MSALSICFSHPLGIVAYLSGNFFNGVQNIAHVVLDYSHAHNSRSSYDYNKSFVILSLVEKIIGMDKNEPSNDLTTFLSKNVQTFPDFAKYPLDNPDGLRKICCFISGEFSLFNDETRFVASIALHFLNRLHKVNNVDVISLEEIADGDLFTADNGQRFSVTSLMLYHNTRPYRGSAGEQYGKKFILNPMTNEFFSFRDTFAFIDDFTSYHTDKELLDLSNDESLYGLSLHSYYSDSRARVAKWKPKNQS